MLWYTRTNVQKPPRCISSREHGRNLYWRFDMSSIPYVPGIYQILCIPTSKVYIGSAKRLAHRKGQHWSMLRLGRHENTYLQHAWNKYGPDAFTFVVLELCALEHLLAREQYWIDTTRCYERDRGFNRRLIAESDRGVKREGQALENIRRASQGRPKPDHLFTPEARERHRIAQLARRGRPFTEEHKRNLSEAKMGRARRPEVVEHYRQVIQQQLDAMTPEDRARRGMPKGIDRYYEVTDPQGNTYHVVNLAAFCGDHGLNRSCMGAVAFGRQAHHRGWTCKRVERVI